MPLFQIEPICAFVDNYIWIIKNNRFAAIVDPGDAEPVFNFLQQKNLEPTAILITHHHNDHIGGIDALIARYGNLPVYGPSYENIPHLTVPLSGDEQIYLDKLGLTLKIIYIPGHTRGHIAYYATIAHQHSHLFCGDTLFATGCGKVLEGTPAQMLSSLKTLACLPECTSVYCAHEYTLNNIRFALAVEPSNLALQDWNHKAKTLRQQHQATLPTTISHELRTNPFLRCSYSSVAAAVQNQVKNVLSSELEVFVALRQWKNNFK